MSILSFYYTNKSIELLKEKDPLMQEIKQNTSNYYIEPINAEIIDNKIIPGLTGKEIDYEISYNNMKKYGEYSEKLLQTKEITPTISLDNNYDKLIVSGNPINKKVAIVLKISDNYPNEIIEILKEGNVLVTIFIDGLFLETNQNKIKDLKNYELEILSYNSKYEEILFTSSKLYLESLTDRKTNYCFSNEYNEKLIKICEKLKLHTITPTLSINSHLFQTIKNNLENGLIILIENNTNTKKELKTTIEYIKQRGYELVTLNDLLSEKIDK